MTKGKIFISYNRQDAHFALRLAKDLIAHGNEIWIDQLNIPPGARWDNEIQTALTGSSRVLVILSPASASSERVMDEVSFALENSRRVIPVIAAECKVLFRLKRLQYIDFTSDYHSAFNSLVTELKAPVKVPVPPVIKHFWQSKSFRAIAVIVFVVGLAILLYSLLHQSPGKVATGRPSVNANADTATKDPGMKPARWSQAEAMITSTNEQQTTVKAETFCNCISVQHDLTLDGQDIPFEKMKSFEVLEVNPVNATLLVTFPDGHSIKGSMSSACDFFGFNDLGRFSITLQNLKRVDFSR